MTTRKSSEIKVSIARLSRDVLEITVRRGGILKDALVVAGYGVMSLKGLLEGVRVNGARVGLAKKLRNGDFITITPRVEGGR